MTFLNAIETYLRENSIDVQFISINTNSLPIQINNAIDKLLLENSSKCDVSKKKYEIRFDSNNNAYLYIEVANYDRMVVLKDRVLYDKSILGTKVSERRLLNTAVGLDYTNYVKSTSQIDKRFVKSYNECESIEAMLAKATIKLNEYFLYINNEYKISQEPIITNISYEEPSASPVGPKLNIGGNSAERKHPIINMEQREMIYMGYKPIIIGEVNEQKTNTLTYKSFLYKINDEHYFIAIEPIDGERYTKAFYYSGDMNATIFGNLVSGVLSLSKFDVAKSSEICNITHSSLQNFNTNIAFALSLKVEKVNTYTTQTLKKCRDKCTDVN